MLIMNGFNISYFIIIIDLNRTIDRFLRWTASFIGHLIDLLIPQQSIEYQS